MTARSLLWLVIALLSLGCRSGGDPPVDPPIVTSVVIESVAPTGLIGTPGDAMTFSATMRGGSGPVSYEWSFGTGATPATSTESAPQIALGVAGTYSGSLRLTDGKSEDVVTFEYRVTDTPVVQSVTSSDPAPTPLGTLDFAVNALGEPTSFAWDFGGGAVPQFSTEPSPRVTVQEIGGYEGTLIVSNEHGAAAPIEFRYAVTVPDDPTWRKVKLTGERPTGAAGLAMIEHQEHLALAFGQLGSGGDVQLRFVRAQVPHPITADEFQGHQVVEALAGPQSAQFSCTDGDGVVYVAFQDMDSAGTPRLRVAHSLALIPNEPTDWAFNELDATLDDPAARVATAIFLNQLLVLVDGPERVNCWESTPLPLTAGTTWRRNHIKNPGYASAPPTVQILNSTPYLAATGGGESVLFRPGNTSDLSQPWERIQVFGDYQPDLAAPSSAWLQSWQGLPILLSLHSMFPTSTRESWLHIAAQPHPEPYGFFEFPISEGGTPARGFGLGTARGRLAALIGDNASQTLMLSRLVSTHPERQADWVNSPVTAFAPGSALPAAMTVFNDDIVVAFVDPVDGILTLAFAEGNY